MRGAIRRDCLHNVVIFDEQRLRHLLNREYYYESRTHLSLKKDAPIPHDVQSAGTEAVAQAAKAQRLQLRTNRLCYPKTLIASGGWRLSWVGHKVTK